MTTTSTTSTTTSSTSTTTSTIIQAPLTEYIIDVYLEDFISVIKSGGTVDPLGPLPPDTIDPYVLIILAPSEPEPELPSDPGGGKRVARIYDRIIHGGRSGIIIQGQKNLTTNSRYTARLTDAVICRRRHHGLQHISGASITVTAAGGLGVARKGDPCTCGARINQASPNVVAGD